MNLSEISSTICEYFKRFRYTYSVDLKRCERQMSDKRLWKEFRRYFRNNGASAWADLFWSIKQGRGKYVDDVSRIKFRAPNLLLSGEPGTAEYVQLVMMSVGQFDRFGCGDDSLIFFDEYKTEAEIKALYLSHGLVCEVQEVVELEGLEFCKSKMVKSVCGGYELCRSPTRVITGVLCPFKNHGDNLSYTHAYMRDMIGNQIHENKHVPPLRDFLIDLRDKFNVSNNKDYQFRPRYKWFNGVGDPERVDMASYSKVFSMNFMREIVSLRMALMDVSFDHREFGQVDFVENVESIQTYC